MYTLNTVMVLDRVMGRMGNSAVPLVLLLLCTASFQLAHGSVLGCGGFVQVTSAYGGVLDVYLSGG